MSYANYWNDERTAGQGLIIGCYKHKQTGAFFEYAHRTTDDGDWAPEFPHVVFMSDGSRRFARVLRTVAHVVTDEADDGTPLSERWEIKTHRKYEG